MQIDGTTACTTSELSFHRHATFSFRPESLHSKSAVNSRAMAENGEGIEESSILSNPTETGTEIKTYLVDCRNNLCYFCCMNTDQE